MVIGNHVRRRGGGSALSPGGSNWAFRLNANYVKQRDWRSAQDMMKFTDYSVKTGHLTAYWTPSFAQDVLVKASVGRYLAGDKGGTLEYRTLRQRHCGGRIRHHYQRFGGRSMAKGSSPKGFT
ncbi:YjbH domain-containing protein [Escherichia coli]